MVGELEGGVPIGFNILEGSVNSFKGNISTRMPTFAVSHISAAIPTTGFRKLRTGASQTAPTARVPSETN